MTGKSLVRLKDKVFSALALGGAALAIATTVAVVLAYTVLYLGFPFAIIWVAIHFLRKVW